MQACGNCGQRKTADKTYCTWCGASFGDYGSERAGRDSPLPAVAWRPPEAATLEGPVKSAAHAEPPAPAWSPAPSRPPVPSRPRAPSRPRYLAAAIGAIGALALFGLGVGAWLLVGHSGTRASDAGNQADGAVASTRSATAPPAGAQNAGTHAASPGPSSGSPAATLPAGPVTVALAATANPAAPGITAFLDKYFTSINDRDYEAYKALRSPQMATGFTKSVFDSGYGSTVDSGELLTRISSASDGDSVAHVTFTSRQSAAESPTRTTCDRWTISFYLMPDGSGGYLMDTPPSGYHAKYAAC
jgi:hypothetical protein